MGLLEVVWEHFSLKGTAVILVWIWVVSSILSRVRENRRIRAIGPSAPKVPARWPWALDVVYSVVQSTIHHKNYERWQAFFNDSGTDINGTASYTTELRAVNRRCVFTADPENIKAILATQFSDFGKGEIFHKEWSEFLGDSIFTTDGQKWHKSRQLLRPQFSRDRISDLHCFESHLQTLYKAIANGGALRGEDQQVDMAAVNGRPIDISDLFFRYTLDVATDFLLGKDVKSLRSVLPSMHT